MLDLCQKSSSATVIGYHTIVNLELLHKPNLGVEPLPKKRKCQDVLDDEDHIRLRHQPPLWVREVDLVAIGWRDDGCDAVNCRHDVATVGQRTDS